MREECVVYRTMEFMGKRWAILILFEFYKGNNEWKRYSVIKKRLLNITPKVLSMRLRELTTEELIEKRSHEGYPKFSEYRLTEAGEAFAEMIPSIKDWAKKWKFKEKVCEQIDCKKCMF